MRMKFVDFHCFVRCFDLIDSLKLMLNSVLNCLFDSLNMMLRKNVEKRCLYENLDLVLLTLDEICDQGSDYSFFIDFQNVSISYRIILEADSNAITQRVQLRQDDIPLGEQTMAQVNIFLRFK